MSEPREESMDDQLKMLRSQNRLDFDKWCASHPESIARLNPFVTAILRRMRIYQLCLTAVAIIGVIASSVGVSWLTSTNGRSQIATSERSVLNELGDRQNYDAATVGVTNKDGVLHGKPNQAATIEGNQRMRPMVVKYLLMVQDMNRALKFYRDTMGFTEGFTSPHWSELRFGDAVLALHGGGDGSPSRTGLSLQYEDVSKAFEVALSSGAVKVSAPERREGEPIVLASIRDPEGNEIMLTQYIGSH